MHPQDRKVIPLEGLDTSLDDFNSEVGRGLASVAAPSLPERSSPHDIRRTSVSLAELLLAGTRVESYEAVSIVQALCAVVAESSPLIGTTSVELQDVYIHADGSVSSRSTGPIDPAASVQCLGHLLAQLLPEKDFMFLRERVVEKATSSPPFYLSLQELSDTLGYYERPGRAVQIRNVFDRWQTPGPAPASEESKPRRKTQSALGALLAAHWRQVQIGSAVAGLLAVSLVGYLLIGPSRSPGRLPTPPSRPQAQSSQEAAPPAPSPQPANPVSAPVAEVSRSAAPQRPAPAPSLTPRKPDGVATSVSTDTRRASPTPGKSDTRRITLRLADPQLSVGNVGAAGNVAAPQPPPANRDGEPSPAEGTTYSVNDTDVVPPSVLYSQLPGPSPLFAQQHDVPALEVIVTEKGLVDSVRAVARPRTIAESVVLTNGLSAAKAWRFRPATKDGRPVRYRLLVALSTD